VAPSADHANRWPITFAIMLATIMNTLDTTIANIALPHIQGSLSASTDEITWVLTSYIVAATIMTPLTGWLADRLGRKLLFLTCIIGFTIASMLCGVAQDLPQIVLFRVLQGVFGASMIPLGQAILLDVHPPEDHGKAMAIWGAGVIVGPILGPALGGWLTEMLSWRWVFFINLPVGLVALAGVWFFIHGERVHRSKPFDFLGFGSLAVFIAGLQLMLDRGPGEDWFYSLEIWIEALAAAIGLWVFIIWTMTAKHPFLDRRLIADRNFVTSTIFGFFVGVMLFSSMALIPPLMQSLMGYPVLTAGIVSMPRGLGTLVAMLFVGRAIGRVDTRLILFVGLVLSAASLWGMTKFDLSMTSTPLIVTGFFQGMGMGMIFVPLSTVAFATLPGALRAEASGISTLIRSLGSAVGISIMNALAVYNTQAMHGSLAALTNPADPVVRAGMAGIDMSTEAGLLALNGEITRQAAMVAYVDDFRLMLVITIVCMPMLMFLRRPKGPAPSGGPPVADH